MERKKKKKNNFCPHWVRTQENSNSSEKPQKKKKPYMLYVMGCVCVARRIFNFFRPQSFFCLNENGRPYTTGNFEILHR